MAEKRIKRPRDPIQLAKLMGDILTGQVQEKSSKKEHSVKRMKNIKVKKPNNKN